jgi:hypothetical protein
MKNDEYERLAEAIWQGDSLTIAALQDMTADDTHEVEKAFRDKYGADINLNTSAAEIHSAVGKIRAGARVP